MKVGALCLGVLLVALSAGCDWSPPRDNPSDPGSFRYDGPATIVSAWIEVHCQLRAGLDVCYMTLFAYFDDPEGVSSHDSAWAYFEDELLGAMGYVPFHDRFTLSIYFESDTLDSSLSYYLFEDFSVEFLDDAGHRTQQSVQILNPISHLNGYPDPGYPLEGYIIDNPQPNFVWDYTTEYEFTFRVTCTGLNFFWEKSGIPKDCTSVWMGPNDSLAASVQPEPYIWTVTAVDNGGNTATSAPIKFWLLP